MASPGNDLFGSLDDSLLCKILESVLNINGPDSQLARIRCSAVCKRFKEVEHQIPSLTWYFDQKITEEAFLRWVINNRVAGLKTLCLNFSELRPQHQCFSDPRPEHHDSLKPILIAALLPSLETLRDIDIVLPYSGLFEEEELSFLYQIARACPVLETFTYSGDSPLLFEPNDTTVFPTLRCLGYDVAFPPEQAIPSTLGSMFPALKELHLMQLQLGFDGGTSYEVSSNSLTYFNCDITSSSKEPLFLRLHCPNIVSVGVRYSDDSSLEIQIRCPKLRMLSLKCFGRREETFGVRMLEKLEAPLQALVVDNVPYTCIERLLSSTEVDNIRARQEGRFGDSEGARSNWPPGQDIQKLCKNVSFHSSGEMLDFHKLLRETAIKD